MDAVAPEKLPLPANGDEDRGSLINAFAWWTTALALVLVALRILTTLAIVKSRLWFDDWHIIAALVATIISAVLTSQEVGQGFGRHAHYLSRDGLSNYLALNYGSWILFYFTTVCTKVSICFFLLKLPISSAVRRALWISVVAIVIAHLAFLLLWALHCVPPNAAWDFGTQGTCLDRSVVLNAILAQGILSAICDYALALCPLAIAWSLPLSKKQSFGLCGLMGLGVIVGSCCVVRAFLNSQALPDDATYTFVTYWFWRLIEMQLGIICACIPSLIPLYESIRDRLTGEERSSFTSLMSASPDLELPPRHPNVSDQSEKAFLGRAAIFRPDEVEAQNRMMERPLPKIPESHRPQRDSDLRTFWSDESSEDMAAASVARYRPLPPAGMNGSQISFSTRDGTRHQATIPARSASPSIAPPDVLVTAPHGGILVEQPSTYSAHPAIRSIGRRPTVRFQGDPQELDLDLTPSFQRNRGAFGRILGIERASWRSSMMSMYSARSQGGQAEGRGLMHEFR